MKRLIATASIALLVILLASFPARVAYHWFAPAELRMSGIAGSIWSGTAAEGMAGGAYVRNIAWRFKPASLLSGNLAFATTANPVAGSMNTDVAVSTDGTLTFSGLSGNVPLDLVHPAFKQSGIGGDIVLQFETLAIRSGLPVAAQGSVTIVDLFLRDLAGTSIGNYRADFQSADGNIVANVEDLTGVLDVSGSINLGQDRSYTFIGLVAATSDTPQSIVNQLRFLGSANERGQYEFRFEGQL